MDKMATFQRQAFGMYVSLFDGAENQPPENALTGAMSGHTSKPPNWLEAALERD